MVYQSLAEDQISAKYSKKIKQNPLSLTDTEGKCNLSHIQTSTEVYNSNPTYVSIYSLVQSSKHENFCQCDIDPRKVIKILFTGPNCLIKTSLLDEDIVIGILKSSFDPSCSIEKLPFCIISGRHRLVSLLTWAKYSGLDEKEYLDASIRVVLKVFSNSSDLHKSIIASNGSRNMPKTELINIQAATIGENTIPDVTQNFGEANLTFTEALAQNLCLHQVPEKVFRSSEGILLTRAVLLRIAYRLVVDLRIPKKDKTSIMLSKLTVNLLSDLPKVLKEVKIQDKESIGGVSYIGRIVLRLMDNLNRTQK
jgi:hypothetical protein